MIELTEAHLMRVKLQLCGLQVNRRINPKQVRHSEALPKEEITTKDTKSTKDGIRRPLQSRELCHHELQRNRITFQLQHPQPVQYKDIRLDCGYRIDVLVEAKLIVELKSVEE